MRLPQMVKKKHWIAVGLSDSDSPREDQLDDLEGLEVIILCDCCTCKMVSMGLF